MNIKHNKQSYQLKTFFYSAFVLLSFFVSSIAHAETGWVNVNSSVSVSMTRPVLIGRSTAYLVSLSVTNTGTETLTSPLRLVYQGLLPSSASIAFPVTGTTPDRKSVV